MPERVRDVVDKVRSKNAGPFWLTIDIFCPSEAAYRRLSEGLATGTVAQAFRVEGAALKRFDLPDLNVVKFSLPRPAVQGTAADRDMHGAAWAQVVAELPLESDTP